MKNKKNISVLLQSAIGLGLIPFNTQKPHTNWVSYPYEFVIPMGGNTFRTAGGTEEEIKDEGVLNWRAEDTEYTVYFALSAAKKGFLNLNILPQNGNGKITVSTNGKTIKAPILNEKSGKIPVGLFNFKEGYNKITLKGISKSGFHFARITDLIVQYGGDTVQANFVRDNEGNNFYWGKRGASVHLNYDIPKDDKFWGFYNELTVLEDPIGSFFMANGFKEGYFGIQVNSKTERRVLFSVWSPFETDNPKNIPEDQKVKLLKKGKDVHIGEFGDEGSGGQSYLIYNWKAGTTYKFFNTIMPDQKGNTIYTAYFMDSKVGKWQLIAAFLRPKTNTSYTNPHSFVENFEPENGYLSRKVLFTNQVMYNSSGTQIPIIRCVFTGDAIAKKSYRLDFSGGIKEGGFFLQNGGFLNLQTKLKRIFRREEATIFPEIDLARLE